MNTFPDISVIIPAYNVEEYIIDCLESISRQTAEISVECIIVDDHSTDNTLALVNRYVNDYRGHVEFKVLTHRENQGQGVARNTGLDNARGRYVFFMDSDDTLTDEAFMLMMTHVTRHPGVDMVVAVKVTEPRDAQLDRCFELDALQDVSYIDDIEDLKRNYFKLTETVIPRLYRREFLDDNNLRFIGGVKLEDFHFQIQAFSAVRSFALCYHTVYIYRIRQGSTMNVLTWQRSIDYRLTIYLDLLERCFEYDKYLARYMVKMLGNICVEIKNLGLTGEYREKYLELVKLMSSKSPRRTRPVFAYLKVPRPFMRGIVLKPLSKILL
jgi:glycosyltransferase involved in cell wall biosynthesis